MKKQKHNGMHSLLAVIALMLAASIYASCSSDDDAWDSSSLGELGTMADGTLDRSGEGGGTVYFVGEPLLYGVKGIEGLEIMNTSFVNIRLTWIRGYTGNIRKHHSDIYATITDGGDEGISKDTICNLYPCSHRYYLRGATGEWTPHDSMKVSVSYLHEVQNKYGTYHTYFRTYTTYFSLNELGCVIDTMPLPDIP